MTFGAANPGKTALKPATTQKLLYATEHNRPQGSRAGLEAFFVTTDVAVEVLFKELIKIQMPPLTLLSVIVDRSGFATFGAGPLGPLPMLESDVDALGSQIHFDFSNSPWMAQLQQGSVKLGILHLGLPSTGRPRIQRTRQN